MAYFSSNDRQLIESLEFDSSLEPAFDIVKGCLVWSDERADGLTPDGYEKLCDLWIARSFIHRKLPFSSWVLDPSYFEIVWKQALEDGFNWPGFNRLELSEQDRLYFEEQLALNHS